MNNHKDILEHIMAQEDARQAIEDLWKVGETDKVGDLTVKLISQEVVDYSEGTVCEDFVYEINGLLFLRQHQYNSWNDYYEDGFELLPAESFTTTGYRVIR